MATNKIAANSPSRAHPTEIETNIASALYDLETNQPDMKSALRPLQIVSAREVRPAMLQIVLGEKRDGCGTAWTSWEQNEGHFG